MTHDDLPCSPAPTAPAPATGVAGLRQHTAARHRALEATPLARALLSPMLSLAAYRQVLAAWADAMAPLEQALAASPHRAALGALVPAPRQALAQADLQVLAHHATPGHATSGHPTSGHATTNSTAVQAEPMARLAAATATPAGLMGLCYVLRGASLGGQVMARHLKARLGLDAASGAAYFGTEPAGAPSWPRWMAAADAWLASTGVGAGDADRQARQGAAAAFDTLLAAFIAAPVSASADTPPDPGVRHAVAQP